MNSKMLTLYLLLGFMFICCVNSASPSTCSHCLGSHMCNPPDCFCCRDELKLPLSIRDIPQIVFFTFDDAVTNQVAAFYRRLFDSSRKNPNGCPISMTLFISHENTDYHLVSEFYQKGMEIAAHSVTHTHLNSENFLTEAKNQKLNLAKLGNVPAEKIKGWRSPFLEPVGDAQPDILKQLGYKYDATLTFSKRRLKEKGPVPFTLDFGWPYECQIKPCPLSTHKGFWEVPIISLLDYLKKYDCVYVDGCLNPPPDENAAYNFLWNNFQSYYRGNRAPFGINMHPAWFFVEDRLQAMDRFIQDLSKMNDVYIVSTSQMIDWLQKPTPLSQLKYFEPWACNGRNGSNVHSGNSVGQSQVVRNIPSKLEVRRQQVLQRWQKIKELQRERRLRQQREMMRGTVQAQPEVSIQRSPPSWTIQQRKQENVPSQTLKSQLRVQQSQRQQQPQVHARPSLQERLLQQRLLAQQRQQQLLAQHTQQQQLLMQAAMQQQSLRVQSVVPQPMEVRQQPPRQQPVPQQPVGEKNKERIPDVKQIKSKKQLAKKTVQKPQIPQETAQEQTDLAQTLLAQQKRLSHVLQGGKKARSHLGRVNQSKNSRKQSMRPQHRVQQVIKKAKAIHNRQKAENKRHKKQHKHVVQPKIEKVTLSKVQEVENKNAKISQPQDKKQQTTIQQSPKKEQSVSPKQQKEIASQLGLQPLPVLQQVTETKQVETKKVNRPSQEPIPKLGLQPLPDKVPTEPTAIPKKQVVNPKQDPTIEIVQEQGRILQPLPDTISTVKPEPAHNQQQEIAKQQKREEQLLVEQKIKRQQAIQNQKQIIETVRKQQQEALKQQQLELQRQQQEAIQRQQMEEQARRQRQELIRRQKQLQQQTQMPWLEQQTAQWAQAHIPPTVPQTSQDSWRRFLMFIMGEA